MSKSILPSLWELARIGDLCDPIEFIMPEQKSSGSFRYVDISSIDRNLKVITEVSEVTNPGAPSRARQIIATNDVLVSTVRPRLNAVALVPAAFDGEICSTGFCVLRAKQNVLEPEYLFAWVRYPGFVQSLIRLERGIGYPAVSDSDVKNLQIPLPPLSEQSHIVTILRQVEEIRRLRWRADAAASKLVSAIYYELFGDPVTNPKRWKMLSLSEVGYLDRGKSQHRPRNAGYLYSGPYPFIQTGDVANSDGWITEYSQTYSEAGLSQSRLWPKGTLCITIAANIARTAILTFDACFPDSIVGFIPGPNVVAEYVRQWFVAIQGMLERLAPQAAQKNINLQLLRNLQLPLPPMSLQAEFAAKVTEIRGVTEQQANARRHADTLFQSLLARAFIGELTATWREKHSKELQDAAIQRDIAIGLDSVRPLVINFEEGKVTQAEKEEFERILIEQAQPMLDNLVTMQQQIEAIVNLPLFTSFADLIRPALPSYSDLVIDGLSKSIATLDEGLLSSLAQMSNQLSDTVQVSLADASNIIEISQALVRQIANIALMIQKDMFESEPYQTWRPIRSTLDLITLSLLKSAEKHTAYFCPQDLVSETIGLVEAEEGLHILAALGFVRQVQIRGQVVYRLVNPETERALSEGLQV